MTLREEITFGSWLRQRRKELDLTQEALANCVGCSEITIRKVEAGNYRLSKQMAQRLAACLQISPDRHEAVITFARTGRWSSDLDIRSLSPELANLPLPLTSLIGREKVTAALRTLLMTPRVPIVTLVGPPGVGKTRLALQVASELTGAFQDGVFFVPLAPLTDPQLVPATIAQVLRLPEPGGRSVVVSLNDFLRDKQVLLLLDNFEQVVEASPFVSEMIARSPFLKVLVTSRQPLGIQVERQYPVRPLTVPELEAPQEVETAAGNPSVRLFVERARLVDPEFELTAENARAVAAICCRLDGLPLAIELAAARMKLFSPHEMLTQLNQRLKLLRGASRDLPPRHQTLRAAIDWSYHLLDAREKILFARLAVFVGGFNFAAADAVCDADGELALDVTDGLGLLLDKSLLQREPDRTSSRGDSKRVQEPTKEGGGRRFTMLETIREYALEQLEESGSADTIRRRHAQYVLTMAEASYKAARGPEQSAWMERLEREHDNLRAALQWCQSDQGDPKLGLQLAAELGWFWFVRGHWDEGRRWLSGALSQGTLIPRGEAQQPEGVRLTRFRARALSASGRLALQQGDHAGANHLFEESLMLWRTLGEKRGILGILTHLGHLALERGDFVSACSYLEESLLKWRELGDALGIAEALSSLGLAVGYQGDYKRAIALMNEGIQTLRELGDNGAVANGLQNMAQMALNQGEHEYAMDLIEESMKLSQALNSRPLIADAQMLGASVALRVGNFEQCQEQLKECLTYYQQAGNRALIAVCLLLSAELTLASPAAQQDISRLAAFEHAARLLGAVSALQDATGAAMLPAEHQNMEAVFASVTAQLSEDAFRMALDEGRAMTIEQAIDYALEAIE